MEVSVLKAIEKIQESNQQIKNEVSQLSRSMSILGSASQQQVLNNWQAKNQASINVLVGALSRTTENQRRSQANQMVIDSIYFTTIAERRSKIPAAYTKTFQWMFDEGPQSTIQWTNFAAWCRNRTTNDRLYWIAGKPGSGKSTLMRYLQDNPRTRALLQVWAGSRKLLVASSFFWNPGTAIQKSRVGLLRSLLYGLLQQCPEYTAVAAPWRWRSYDIGAKQLDPWTSEELSTALHELITALSASACLALFVDGLDEVDGDDVERAEVIDLFKQLSSLPYVKVCLSSRPWLIFRDAFEGGPMLLLQDLTRDDIKSYVEDMLEKDKKFHDLMSYDSISCSQLVLEIVGKAQGVFLWVFLVVRSLLQGLQKEDGISDLTRRLRIIPDDLEAYFRQMMTTIEPFYWKEATRMFRLALDGGGSLEAEAYQALSLSLMTVSFLRDAGADPDFAIHTPILEIPKSQAEARLISAKRRLDACCKGFLEAHTSNDAGLFLNQTVELLHRTVSDFLRASETQTILDQYGREQDQFDANLFKAKALVAQIKMLSIEKDFSPESSSPDDFLVLLDECVLRANVYGKQRGELPLDLIVELDAAITKHHATRGGMHLDRMGLQSESTAWWMDPYPCRSAIYTGVETPVMFVGSSSARGTIGHRIPLVETVLFGQTVGRTWPSRPDTALLSNFLEHGVDPNEIIHHDSSVWTLYLQGLRALAVRDKWAEKRQHTPKSDARPWEPFLDITEVLINHGAARKVNIPGSSDTPYRILEKAFGALEARRLMSIARHEGQNSQHNQDSRERQGSRAPKQQNAGDKRNFASNMAIGTELGEQRRRLPFLSNLLKRK